MTTEPQPIGRDAPTVRSGVVLAAGRSSRMADVVDGHSKALLSVGGVSLVERAVHSLQDAGIGRVAVVVGHDAESVAANLAELDVEIVRAPGWELGNGASMAAAERFVGDEEQFALICGDHLFAEGSLDDLVSSTGPGVLADPKPDTAVWAEGTKVLVRGGLATAFAKDLSEPAVDCGAFVFPRSVFAAHRAAALDGDYSLAGAATRLAQETPITVVALRPNAWWQDVDTADDLRAGRSLIRRSLGKDTDGPVSRRLNRPISTRITMALAPLHVSPTAFSIVTLVVGLWAAWLLSAGNGLVGGLLVQAASILDGSDGETARLQRKATRWGSAIDTTFDRAVDAAVYAGLCLWAWGTPSGATRATIILASALAWGALATSLEESVAVFEVPRRQEPWLVAHLGGRDARMLILAIGSVASLPVLALIATGVTFVGSALWRVRYVSNGRGGLGMVPVMGESVPSSLGQAVRIVLFPSVIVMAFVVVLPRFVDLDQVWALIRSLSWEARVVLSFLAIVNLVTYWPVIMVSLPGLTMKQAALACQSSTAVSMIIPAGGALAVGVSYAMYSSWGFAPAAIASSTLATFVAGMSVKLLLPVIALIVLVVGGEDLSGSTSVALSGAILLGLGTISLWGALRAESAARRIGWAIQATCNVFRKRLRRPPVTGLEDRLAHFGERLRGLLRERWRSLTIASIVSQLSVFVVMLAAMRLIGISQDDVSWAQALAVFAAIRLATSVPIVPGNVGFAELGYIGGLALAGGDMTEVVAAVLLFRFLTYFIQIPLGGATFLAWRRQQDSRQPQPAGA